MPVLDCKVSQVPELYEWQRVSNARILQPSNLQAQIREIIKDEIVKIVKGFGFAVRANFFNSSSEIIYNNKICVLVIGCRFPSKGEHPKRGSEASVGGVGILKDENWFWPHCYDLYH